MMWGCVFEWRRGVSLGGRKRVRAGAEVPALQLAGAVPDATWIWELSIISRRSCISFLSYSLRSLRNAGMIFGSSS